MSLAPFLTSILTWLRAGYPEGVPAQDYVPLFALLGTQLTEAEVNAVADELATQQGATSPDAIRVAIGRVGLTEPTPSDIGRVRARLAAGGWPLAPLEHVRPTS